MPYLLYNFSYIFLIPLLIVGVLLLVLNKNPKKYIIINIIFIFISLYKNKNIIRSYNNKFINIIFLFYIIN